jgi:hypothetical protein
MRRLLPLVLVACTSMDNVGASSQITGEGGTDAGGVPVIPPALDMDNATVLASGQRCPFGLAADETTLYWATWDGLFAMDKAGGDVRLVGAMPPGAEPGYGAPVIVPDGDSLYTGPYGVVRLPKGGGEGVLLDSGQNASRYLAVDATDVYFAGWPDGDTSLRRVSKAGGPVVEVASCPIDCGPLAVDERYVFAVSCSLLRVDKRGGGGVLEKAGAAPVLLAEGSCANLGQAIVTDEDNVYWTIDGASGRSSIARIAKSGGEVTILGDTISNLTAIAHDAEFVYWVDLGALEGLGPWVFRIARVAKAGGPVEDLAYGQWLSGRDLAVMGLAVDDSAIYFTRYDDAGYGGTVRMLPKPLD